VDPFKILVSVDERTDAALLRLAADLMGAGPTALTLLATVEIRRLIDSASLAGVTVEARVRAARRRAAGIREVVDEEQPQLLLVTAGPDGSIGEAERELLAAPPCDTIVIRPGRAQEVRSVLVPARGGPTAERALASALNLAGARGASLTLLHLDLPGATLAERQHELRLFGALLSRSTYTRLRSMTVPAPAAEPALLAEAERHQVVVLGASAGRDMADGDMLGPIPSAMLAASPATVLVVKPRRAADASVFTPRPPLDVVVDKWFVENTFHCREFADLGELVRAKREQRLTVSLIILPSGDAAALPAILRIATEELQTRQGLVDEVIVVDNGQGLEVPDMTAAAKVDLCRVQGDGRGQAIRAALDAASGDIVVWLDRDIRNMHPRYVYGLVGPILREPRIALVTGFHGLPDTDDDALLDEGQEQITELAVRPLINLYFPELSGIVNPLARERAARRDALTGLRLSSGQGVDVAMLLDVHERSGLWAVAQADLEERAGRREGVREVTRRAFASVQALSTRLPARANVVPLLHPSMKLIHRQAERYHIEVVDTAEEPLPPVPLRQALAAAAPRDG
jgi:glucosyl-3-phosphoglycerate synthase